jgi:hypothetical protein
LLPSQYGKGRPFRDHRQVIEGIVFRYRAGIDWRVSVDSSNSRVHHHGATAKRSSQDTPSYTGGPVESQETAPSPATQPGPVAPAGAVVGGPAAQR